MLDEIKIYTYNIYTWNLTYSVSAYILLRESEVKVYECKQGR